jgi:hypothetical protein
MPATDQDQQRAGHDQYQRHQSLRGHGEVSSKALSVVGIGSILPSAVLRGGLPPAHRCSARHTSKSWPELRNNYMVGAYTGYDSALDVSALHLEIAD